MNHSFSSNRALRRVCIVTPDLVGPVRNGGIGTHCTNLLKLLASVPELSVSVLFTGPYEQSSVAEVRESYQQIGISYHCLSELPSPRANRLGKEDFFDRSLKVDQFLRNHPFDIVHLQDWRGNGFVTVQSKRTGVAHRETQLILTVHSPSRWVREGSVQWAETPQAEVLLDYMERYTIEHADAVIFPSHAMQRWVADAGWRCATNARVIPYCFSVDEAVLGGDAATVHKSVAVDPSHLAFFGRLETRKGIEPFIAAVSSVTGRPSHGIRKVSLVGKFGTVLGGAPAQQLVEPLRATLSQRGIELSVLTQFDAAAAMQYLRSSGAIVFAPSLQDNLPFAVIECVENNLPLFTSRIGGIPEIINGGVLFEPTTAGITAAITDRVALLPSATALYRSEMANQSWLALHAGALPERAAAIVPAASSVSICVAHYNHARYLPTLVKSLFEQTVGGFEVVVVDDGSTAPEVPEMLLSLEREFGAAGLRIIRKSNEGIGATRNRAAAEARGSLLIFMDADNVALPTMVESFLTGIGSSRADCLTAYFSAFESETPPTSLSQSCYCVTPIGPCVLLGLIANVFGDANLCIRRDVFAALGGFGTDRGSSFEDWEFLARLSLRGFSLDVIPSDLFWYRHLEGGFSRATNPVRNYARVLTTYQREAAAHSSAFLGELTLPLAKQVERYVQHSQQLSDSLSAAKLDAAQLRSALQGYDRAGYRLAGRVLSFLDNRVWLKKLLSMIVNRK